MRIVSIFMVFAIVCGSIGSDVFASDTLVPSMNVPAKNDTGASPTVQAPTLTFEGKGAVKKPLKDLDEESARQLKAVELAGGATAGAGAGFLGYAVFAEAFGPAGWALALVFMGGMALYLAHRGLNGESDFGQQKPPAPRTAPPSAAPQAPAPAPEPAAPSM